MRLSLPIVSSSPTNYTLLNMKMNFLILLISMSLKLGLSVTNQNNELQMIVDVINSYDKPTTVVANVCWKSPKKLALAKLMMNSKNPKAIRYIRGNETIMKILEDHLMFVVDVNCDDVESFLKQADSKRMFTKTYRWLILGRPVIESDAVTSEFKDLSILLSSEFIVSQEIEDSYIIFYTAYKIKRNTEWIIEHFATWENNNGLSKTKEMTRATAIRRRNFRRESIVTSLVATEESTKTDLLEPVNLLVDSLTKNTFRNINPLYEFLNASKVLIYSDTWGYFVNGSWTGMVGDVAQGKAELAGTVTLFSEIRMTVLEYLSHPSPSTAKFVFREPPLSYQNNLFVLPFKATVWYCTAGFVLILMFVLYINAIWEMKKSEYSEEDLEHTALRPSLSDIAILIVGAVSQQGCYHELKGTLGRLVMFILFLTFLFLYTSYSACIVALLQSSSNQIRTLSDLLNSKLELGVEDEPYNRYYFSTATDPVRKAIYETKVAPKGSKPNFMNLEDGVKKLQNKPFAFNMNIGSGYRLVEKYFHEHEKCGLREIEFLQHNQPWLSCRKYSPNSEIYKIGYFRIREHGISDRENRVVYTKKPVCSIRGSSFGSVNMMDFYPILLMLLYGMTLAFLLLLCEILVYKKQVLHKRTAQSIISEPQLLE